MSWRTHLGLRLGGLLVLVVLALLPRNRTAHPDPAITVNAPRAHEAHALELVSAKPTGTLSATKPRPRTPRLGGAIDEAVVANVDESRLTN